jgi:hypothetical protein
MPCIVTTIHNPNALATICRRLSFPAPTEGTVQLGTREVSGWLVRLPGVLYPIVCDTLSGLIAYHPSDNCFGRYARIMRFVHCYYAIHAEIRQLERHTGKGQTAHRMHRRPVLARQGG